MDRRNFLLAAPALALWSMKVNNVHAAAELLPDERNFRRRYQYVPNEQDSCGQIENDILPEQAKPLHFWDIPRQIDLYRPDTKESSSVMYFQDGKINQHGYWLASYLLRDNHAKKMVWVDPRLLDLLCAVQAWLRVYNMPHRIHIHSGFRTQATNRIIEGSAQNSMHMYGKAIDFSVPGVSEKVIATLAAKFRAGGIGLYLNKKFTHLDTGGVRVWVK